MNSFEELEVWKMARTLKQQVLFHVKTFPDHERYNLTFQLLRSSRSVTANIAEGFGRFHFQENIQFCRQARGSLSETLDHLLEANDCGYIKSEDLAQLRLIYDQCSRLLNGYIAYLNRQKTNNKVN